MCRWAWASFGLASQSIGATPPVPRDARGTHSPYGSPRPASAMSPRPACLFQAMRDSTTAAGFADLPERRPRTRQRESPAASRDKTRLRKRETHLQHLEIVLADEAPRSVDEGRPSLCDPRRARMARGVRSVGCSATASRAYLNAEAVSPAAYRASSQWSLAIPSLGFILMAFPKASTAARLSPSIIWARPARSRARAPVSRAQCGLAGAAKRFLRVAGS